MPTKRFRLSRPFGGALAAEVTFSCDGDLSSGVASDKLGFTGTNPADRRAVSLDSCHQLIDARDVLILVQRHSQPQEVARGRAVQDFPVGCEFRPMTLAEERLVGLRPHLAAFMRADRRKGEHLLVAADYEKTLLTETVVDAVGREIGGRSPTLANGLSESGPGGGYSNDERAVQAQKRGGG